MGSATLSVGEEVGGTLACRSFRSQLAPRAIGTVLLCAAGLKAHALILEPAVSTAATTPRGLLIALIETEIWLGLALVTGFHRRQTTVLALIFFGAVSLAALQRALAGETSCGCFGTLPINPWYTLAFDLCAVASLWKWRTPPGRQLPQGGLSKTGLASIGMAAAGIVSFSPRSSRLPPRSLSTVLRQPRAS